MNKSTEFYRKEYWWESTIPSQSDSDVPLDSVKEHIKNPESAVQYFEQRLNNISRTGMTAMLKDFDGRIIESIKLSVKDWLYHPKKLPSNFLNDEILWEFCE